MTGVRPLRYLTLELFNPEIDLALQHYPMINVMHTARYFGAMLLPLLALFPMFRWRSREHWLVMATVATLIVCLAPPVLLAAWTVVPFMNRVRGLFAFYTQYWQLMLVLLAAVSLERLLGDTDRATTTRLLRTIVAIAAVVAVTLAIGLIVSARFPADDFSLQSVVRAGLMIMFACALMGQRLLFDGPATRRLLGVCFLALIGADLTKYFYQVNLKDRDYTAQYRSIWPVKATFTYPLSTEIRQKLAHSWADADTRAGFASNVYENMPLPNLFWPNNVYLRHRTTLSLHPPSLNAIRDRTFHGPPLEFYRHDEVRPLSAAGADARPADHVLWLADVSRMSHEVPTAMTSATAAPTDGSRGLTVEWRLWSYNTFDFDVKVADDGFLMVRQTHDPLWRITVDGAAVEPVQANIAAMAVPIGAGRHTVRMDYRPLARRLYWPASVVLMATWVVMIGAVVRARRDEGRGA